MNIKELESLLHRRIRLHLANGGTLIRGAFVDEENVSCRCALAAGVDLSRIVADASHPDYQEFAARTACDSLGLDLETMGWITAGFDDLPIFAEENPDEEQRELLNLGRRLAEEYL